MAQSQLRSSELVAFPVINNRPLGLFNELPFPEPDVDEQTYQKPLQAGSYSAGGEIAYDTVEATRVFDPNSDEDLLAFLAPLQGGAGSGVLPYHAAPGKVPASRPLKGQTYDIVLLKAYLSEGVNTEGGDITMLVCEFGINGVGR